MNASTPSRGLRTPWAWRAAGTTLAAALGLSGCAGDLLPKPPAAPLRHTLDTGTAALATPAPPPGAPTLVVAPLTAAAGYDSARLIYLRQPQALEAYAFHEWADTPARLLAPLLVQALQQRGSFRAVWPAPSSAEAALRLETTLLRLHHDLTVQPSVVHLSVRAVLVDTRTRQALATGEFEARVPTTATGPAGAVAAAGVASRCVTEELADFVAATVGDQRGAAAAGALPMCRSRKASSLSK
jgi:cholesterol transport system auxiliary component